MNSFNSLRGRVEEIVRTASSIMTDRKFDIFKKHYGVTPSAYMKKEKK